MCIKDTRGLLLGTLVIGASLVAIATGARAQDPVQREIRARTGQQLSQEEILTRLGQSGLSREQVREQLSSLGYDPAIADPYFDRLETGDESPLTQNADFLQALAQMGLLNEPLTQDLADSPPLSPARQVAPARAGLAVFGQSVFSRATTQFQPLVAGPVDPGYLLGPGDQIQLILTGDVELAYNLDVTREGFIVIPDVGQVFVNGLTLEALRESLFGSLGAIYSGVRRNNPTTRFHVSLGRLRTNQVFLIGEVAFPGAYQVSGAATVFNGLYNAGGPAESGSMRSVQVRRAGRVLRDVDLYDYLVSGDTSDDVRLEQGDLLFVPFAGPRVSVEGMVRRPAIYELKAGEGLRSVLDFAGGPLPEAYVQGIQVERILPVEERTPERERVLIDVDFTELDAGQDFALLDGDRVTVPEIGDRRDNRVALEGHVQKPGVFEVTPGMRLSGLLDRGGGLLPDAFEAIAHLIRFVPADSTYVLEQVSLDGFGRPVVDVPLRELDRVVIYGRSTLRSSAVVAIRGEVKNPGVFPLHEGMTAQDLLLAAGGFTGRADPFTAELVRRADGITLSDTIAVSRNITFGRTLPSALDRMEDGVRPLDVAGAVSAESIALRDGDRIFVRRLQGLREEGDVDVMGEVLYPGPYALERRGERVSALIARAGGLTPEAYTAGARVVRGGLPVGLDLGRALASPGRMSDLLLFPGDRLEVPPYDGTVRVLGAVGTASRVQWRPGLGFGDYLARAGGVTQEGDRGRAFITYANGELDRSGRFLFFRSDPDVLPGSTITVPVKERSEGGGFDVDVWLARVLSLATVIVAVNSIN